ncbi:MAG: hypothetical protein NT166_25810 [Candidatus Aminicenantes bacterium]|nr:hypothetical protein [Candidatus Aminicenantes bacterium]
MSVKEKIYVEIDSLAQNELALLYEQINLIKRVKALSRVSKSSLSIEEIHRYTSSSNTSWAETVSNNREERL